MNTSGLGAKMRVVPARNGWTWLVRGFALFRKNPPMWLFLVFTYVLAVVLLGKLRYLGPATSTVLLPAFSVSFMFVCAVLERGGVPKPALLISGFQRGPSTLLVLGVLYLLSIVGVLALASLADAGTLLLWVLSGRKPSEESLLDGSVSLAMLVSALGAAPVLMAFWFAPVLAAWNRIGAAQSLFYSFFAVWRNWRAFLVYGAALFLAEALFTMAVAILAVLLQEDIQTLESFAVFVTLLAMPTLFASFYASYRDIFPDNAVPAEPPSNAAGP
jgi:hypothetical protein